jgi:hypothetical protein
MAIPGTPSYYTSSFRRSLPQFQVSNRLDLSPEYLEAMSNAELNQRYSAQISQRAAAREEKMTDANIDQMNWSRDFQERTRAGQEAGEKAKTLVTGAGIAALTSDKWMPYAEKGFGKVSNLFTADNALAAGVPETVGAGVGTSGVAGQGVISGAPVVAEAGLVSSSSAAQTAILGPTYSGSIPIGTGAEIGAAGGAGGGSVAAGGAEVAAGTQATMAGGTEVAAGTGAYAAPLAAGVVAGKYGGEWVGDRLGIGKTVGGAVAGTAAGLAASYALMTIGIALGPAGMIGGAILGAVGGLVGSSTWLCTAIEEHVGVSKEEKKAMRRLRRYTRRHHSTWLASYLVFGRLLVNYIDKVEDDKILFYARLKPVLVYPVVKLVGEGKMEEAFELYRTETMNVIKSYLPVLDSTFLGAEV